ncbi:Hypothetical protein I596_1769 [Dokdonella koreensis DS-123]|uniref:Uncharacterized protein n=1 Tax=Dokdonella koreensis DS-123 TaxID=1300342 RepID=A0A160DVI5_9GAMM|nr:Hypothetical protein I596_1769 [Dokdonella koreensis DS-123]
MLNDNNGATAIVTATQAAAEASRLRQRNTAVFIAIIPLDV